MLKDCTMLTQRQGRIAAAITEAESKTSRRDFLRAGA